MRDYRNWREERRKMREESWTRWNARYNSNEEYLGGTNIGRSGIWTGVFLLLLGVAALIRVTIPDLPDWLFSWQTLLIVIGLFIGVKNGFRGISWLILILIGGTSLLSVAYPDLSIRRYLWPMILIAIGAFLIFRSNNNFFGFVSDNSDKEQNKGTKYNDIEDAKIIDETANSKEDYVKATSVFGGVKKNVISKNFKGGSLVNIFGGTELDLTRSDINGIAALDVTNIFGGAKLIVPTDWIVKSDAAVIFGGVDDKRRVLSDSASDKKTLLIKGTVIFGGIDIKSY